MSNSDGTFTCDHSGCNCRVADDESHLKSKQGLIYCCDECRQGKGCTHEGCNCANN